MLERCASCPYARGRLSRSSVPEHAASSQMAVVDLQYSRNVAVRRGRRPRVWLFCRSEAAGGLAYGVNPCLQISERNDADTIWPLHYVTRQDGHSDSERFADAHCVAVGPGGSQVDRSVGERGDERLADGDVGAARPRIVKVSQDAPQIQLGQWCSRCLCQEQRKLQIRQLISERAEHACCNVDAVSVPASPPPHARGGDDHCWTLAIHEGLRACGAEAGRGETQRTPGGSSGSGPKRDA